MALLAFEDFKSPIGYISNPHAISYSGTVGFGAYGEGGTRGARSRENANAYMIIDVTTTAPTTLFFGTRWRKASAGFDTNDDHVRVNDSTGSQIMALRTGSGGEANIYDAAGALIGATSGAQFGDDNTWSFWEFKLVAGTGVNGTLDIRRNGVSIFSATGQDFTDGNDNIGTVWLAGGGNFGDKYMYFDKLQANDTAGSYNNDWMGEITAEYVMPDGNGNSSNWVGSDGNSTDNYLLVDEATAGGGGRDDADYVQAGTEGNIDLYTYAALSGSGAIVAVDVLPYTMLPDGGSRFIRGKTRISATNYDSATAAVADSEGRALRFESNPNAAAPWTAAAVNGAEFGYEVRDS